MVLRVILIWFRTWVSNASKNIKFFFEIVVIIALAMPPDLWNNHSCKKKISPAECTCNKNSYLDDLYETDSIRFTFVHAFSVKIASVSNDGSGTNKKMIAVLSSQGARGQKKGIEGIEREKGRDWERQREKKRGLQRDRERRNSQWLRNKGEEWQNTVPYCGCSSNICHCFIPFP